MSRGTSSVRSVSLRILREGPTHNHLISPLTPYLAAVGPYEATTVRMPYEHRTLLRNLETLRYGATGKRGPDATRITRGDRGIIADDMGQILAAIPGLTSEMATEAKCEAELTHLRLTFSAAELSMVPFELATAPTGFPGEGFPLSIQSTAPVVITRSIPAAVGNTCNWVREPRILFVVAQPPGLTEVPYAAHLLALSQALRPWIGATTELASSSEPAAPLAKYLRVLPDATLAGLEAAWATESFTHIHILAHSEVVEEGGQSQFALALHDGRGGKELVGAERLQAALRLPTARRPADHQLAHPLVVTLATCDSGLAPQVVFPTMSLAHALHAAGVPLAIGSLFPLSFRGSTVMTQKLYAGLLAGRDPRWCLYDMRHALFRLTEDNHDWAAVVAYASFPEDIESQMGSLAFLASRKGIDAAFKLGRELTDPDTAAKADKDALLAQLDKLDAAIDRRSAGLQTTGSFLLEGQGVQASAEKRRAELMWRMTKALEPNDPRKAEVVEKSKERLRRARERYREGARAPRWRLAQATTVPDFHWVLSQVLSLNFVLGLGSTQRLIDPETWTMARLDAQNYLAMPNEPGEVTVKGGSPAMWAHSSLLEIYLLAHGLGEKLDGVDPASYEKSAEEHLLKHIELARAANELNLTQSTRDQLRRYGEWWCHPDFCGKTLEENPHVKRLVDLSNKLLEHWEPTGLAYLGGR